MSRRQFVRGELSEIPAPLALGALQAKFELADAADFADDVDVLNYALTLEYLESAFYEQGNAKGLLTGKAKTYLARIGLDEAFHVTAITQTIQKLGGTPVKSPTVDFGQSFASAKSYLTTSHTFENTGVGAYLGAAGFVKNKDVLQAAAGIFGVEARHAAIVGNLLGLKAEGGVYMGAAETGIAKKTVLAAVSPFLSQMAGKMPVGGVNTGGGSTAGIQDKALLSAGGAALLGAGVLAYAARHRESTNTES